MIIIYTTFPDREKALEICKNLLLEKLIACFNVFQIDSGYWWDGKVSQDKEFAAILKTSNFKEQEVFKKLKELHPYSVPAIFSVEIKTVDANYKQWLEESLSNTDNQ
ncbi:MULTISPECIES: divalent-cation tolerance protein CutA [Pseudothermotoga]|jgi:periplasmic divalent cation tolerance protein|uniref:divalent-cation tolerance protein CutA n=1 Tax=Pseudothermotoga TaxID=1643951 RepID=UPI0004129434|nr:MULTISPECIES: divalent-cation tolerance protein CutA [Pseudothermotoga]KUK21257.1 MAG: CutA1 divalent ion tolerance protein [Pseudothermotoga lettingae]HBT25313.1 divalent-cation tolerance protein CutA [Pseudothermotoga sp.]